MSNPNPISPTSFHRRNNSGELDVFQATRYFSGREDSPPLHAGVARMSLDLPIRPGTNLLLNQKQESKKFKQPSSPGARLASFLNSLFKHSKKKKTKPCSSSSQNPDGRRKLETCNSTICAGKTPTKSYKKFIRNLSDRHKVQVSVPGNNKGPSDEDFRFSNGNIKLKNERLGLGLGLAENWNWENGERGFRKFSVDGDDADTDSSSDLFDLPNHELDLYSNGLPVYGTTNMDRIRIVAPISRIGERN